MTMLGYFNHSDPDASTLTPDGWLHYGDLGSMDAEGRVRITGRLKDMIIRGGENISPREIEEVLFQHPGVIDVAVVGVPDPRWGEQIAAVIQIEDLTRAPDPVELKRHCRAHLASHKAPVAWYFVTRFPMTASGKVQKFRLRELISKAELGRPLSA